MDCTLSRKSFNSWGIISILTDVNMKQLAITLEHAYDDSNGNFTPKIPNGTYTCHLGTHQLGHGGPQELFQVMDVPGHENILLHKGNKNNDSEGCILLGTILDASGFQILSSTEAFDAFMALQAGQDFSLTVE